MKRHPDIGDMLCAPLQSLQDVRPIIRGHHERLNGSGYPQGLRGDEVPLLAQIVGIVDVYDALTSKRPYRPALTRRRGGETPHGRGVPGQVSEDPCRGVPRHRADHDARLTASRVHLEVRIPSQRIDRDERRAVARGESIFGAAIAASLPGSTNQRGQFGRRRPAAQRTA